MADINSYALNLDFNLQTSAPQTLISVSDQLTTIQNQLQEVASLMSGELTATANSLEDSINGAFAGIKEFNSEFDTIPVDNAIDIKDNFDEITKIQDQLNDNLIDTLDHMKEINGETKDTEKSFGGFNMGVIATAGSFLGLAAAIKEAWAEEEKFMQVGRRMHGTQMEMAQSARAVAFENNLFIDDAVEGYAVVADVIKTLDSNVKDLTKDYSNLNSTMSQAQLENKRNREELAAHTITVTQFNTVTGASIQSTALYIQRLKMFGMTVSNTRNMMDFLTESFKQAGFSAEEVQAIMDGMNESAIDVGLAWGEAGQKGFAMASAELLAMGDAAGLSQDALAQMQKDLNVMATDVKWQEKMDRAFHEMGVTQQEAMQSSDLMSKAFTKAYMNYADEVNQSNNTMEGSLTGLHQLKSATGALGVTHQHFGVIAQKTAGDFVKAEADINAAIQKRKLAEKDGATLEREYQDAIKNTSREWKLLRDQFKMVKRALVARLGPAITVGIKILQGMVKILGLLLGAFEETTDSIDHATGQIKVATGFWDKLTGAFKDMNLSLKNVAYSIGIVVIAAWAAVKAWKLMSKFLKATDIIKLKAIATSALMIGAAMLMMAASFAIVAALGDKVIIPLVAFAAVLGGVILAIAALTFAGPLGVAVMLAFSVMMLSLGAAAIMFATAMWIASYAFDAFVKAAEPIAKDSTFAVNFLLLSASILAGSLYLLAAAPFLLIASAGLLAGMMLLNSALWWIDEGQLGSIANSFSVLAESIVALSNTAANTSQLTAALAALVMVVDKVIDELEDSADRIYIVANKLYLASYMLPMASNAFARAVIDMVNEISRISVDYENLNSIASSYYDLAEAIDWGLDAIESRSRRSKALFGDIIGDFAGMSLAIDRINSDMKTKLGADEVVKQRFEANTSKVATASADKERDVRAQPLHETQVRDTFSERIRKERQEELRAKALINQIKDQTAYLEETAANTGLLKNLKDAAANKEKDSGTPRGSIGSSHVTTWT